MENVVPCSACNATGRVIKDKCSTCSGKGTKRKPITTEISIPAGIADGQILQRAGEGDAPKGGDGVSGNLLVKISVMPHPLLVRKDYDLYLELPVSFTQAIMGDKVQIPTPDGNTTFVIPPYTQNGFTKRLSGKGVKRLQSYGTGDLIVKVIVEMPKSLDRKQLDLIKQLDKDVSQKAYEKRRKYNDNM